MTNASEIDQDGFEKLLKWLDPNREVAAEKYETIRLRLIKIFQYRGSISPEELADETFDRVTKKVPALIDTYEGNPANYFFGVANNVHHEFLRNPRIVELPQVLVQEETEEDDSAAEFECLDDCLNELETADREFIIDYYQDDKKAKIDNRKKLAETSGIGVSGIRVKAFRIRVRLQECVTECLEN